MNRAPRYPSRRWSVAGFAVGVGVAVSLLLLLGYVIGHNADVGLGEFVESILAAASSNGAAVVLAFALVTVGAWCVRRLWLERLAWRPGQVVVPVFSEGTPLHDATTLHLTTLFRQRFASLRLQTLAPVPGSAPEAGFLDVLGQNGADSRNLLGSLLAIARAAKPTHAFVVHGTLIERDQSPRCGVTVQVVRQPDQGAPPDTVYDFSWERAVRRAADRATASILPRTRRCGTPWASWRGFVMPPSLLEAYEAAAELEAHRRYDEALGRYYDALAHDPMNVALRLCVGQLQEKLGLFLDALSTYEGIRCVGAPGDEELPEGRYKRVAEQERARALLIAQYRRVVLLGGPWLGRQWRTSNAQSLWTERDEQRVDLRARLRDKLEAPLDTTAETHSPAAELPRVGTHTVEDLLAEPDRRVPDEDNDLLLHELRELLVLHAIDELPAVRGDLQRLRDRRDVSLTETGVSLTSICLDERCGWLQQQIKSRQDGRRPERWIWDDDACTDLERRVEAAPAGRPMHRWHENYNAACAFALPLLVSDDSDPKVRKRLARAAVDHLAKATGCADSGYIATRRDWLLSEDPDLAGLRAEPAFKSFEALYFPAGAPTPCRPRDVQRLEVATYTGDLLEATARRWEATWHDRQRAVARREDIHVLLDWWTDEDLLWRLVGRVAWNHRRWTARRDLLEATDRLSIKYGGAPLDVGFRTFEEPTPLLATGTPDERSEAALKLSDARCVGLATRLAVDAKPEDARFAIPAIDGWVDRLRALDAEGERPSMRTVTTLCDRHAALWSRLQTWLAVDDERRAPPAESGFAAELDRLATALTAAQTA
jgi:hypothetical protein